MKNTFFYPKSQWLLVWLASSLFCCVANAQTSKLTKGKVIQIPMDATHWDTSHQSVDFAKYQGVTAMQIKGNKPVVLKDVQFTNGTIEFDVAPTDAAHHTFISFYFRQQNLDNNECVYLRIGRDHSEKRNDAVQYAGIVKGVNMWNLLNHFQAPAVIHNADWNHVKLVVNGWQLRAYINDMEHPALEVPRMEGDTKTGAIAVDGFAAYANVVIKPNETEDLPAVACADLTNHDANYLRHWQVSQPRWLDNNIDLSNIELPKDTTKWAPIAAERHAIINVSRLYGLAPERRKRYIWLKTNIHADKDQVATLQLGFCDDVSIFINGGLLYTDKNTYWLPIRKDPEGRCSIENATIKVPLKAGDNQVMIALTNYFYGWGIVARLGSLDGVDIETK